MLARLFQEAPTRWFGIPLEFEIDSEVKWKGTLEQVLSVCHTRPGSIDGGVSLQAELNRLVFAKLSAELIRRNLISCENDEATLNGLQSRPIEMFDLGTKAM